MADDIDRANDRAQYELDAMLAARERYSDQAGRADCGECGEPIPAARRDALPSASTCIDCAQRLEG